MVAVRRKPPTALQNTRGGRGRGVMAPGRPRDFRVPSLPAEITRPLSDPIQARMQPEAVKHARRIWREWWKSPPSMGVDIGSDMEALSWWIICVFRRSLYIQIVRQQPLVKGSMGQPVPNPLERVMARMSEDIARAEARFGMTTLDRFRLHFETKATRIQDDDAPTAIDEYRKALGQ